jgi:hypothetical protein
MSLMNAETAHVAALDPIVGRAQRPRQPIDLDVDVALRRVEPALIDGARDVAPDRALTDHEPLRDLGIGMAGAHQRKTRLAPFGSPDPPLQALGAHGLVSFGGRRRVGHEGSREFH